MLHGTKFSVYKIKTLDLELKMRFIRKRYRRILQIECNYFCIYYLYHFRKIKLLACFDVFERLI